MVTVEIKVFATGPRRQEVLETLIWLMGQLEAEPGLDEMDLYQSVEREDKLVLAQTWRSREDLLLFMRSEKFIQLLEILDLSEEPPELHFDSVSERQSLEFVEAVRQEQPMKR